MVTDESSSNVLKISAHTSRDRLEFFRRSKFSFHKETKISMSSFGHLSLYIRFVLDCRTQTVSTVSLGDREGPEESGNEGDVENTP